MEDPRQTQAFGAEKNKGEPLADLMMEGQSTSSSPSARGTMWQVSRQSSAECPSDIRQKRSTLSGTHRVALDAEMAAASTRFFTTVLRESALILFTGEAGNSFRRLPRPGGFSSSSCSGL